MQIKKKEISASGVKFYVELNGKEAGRAYLYVLTNDLHRRPFGFMEDVFVDETLRGQGIGSRLVKKVMEESQNRDCYKLICTSRYAKPRVHDLYMSLGFKKQGEEFRMDF